MEFLRLAFVLILFTSECKGDFKEAGFENVDYLSMIEDAIYEAQRPLKSIPKPKLVLADKFLAKNKADDIQTRAGELLEAGDTYLAAAENVSDLCRNQTNLYLDALQNEAQWALMMFDSAGKPPSAIFQGQTKWLGNWEECKNVKSESYYRNGTPVDVSTPFVGKYCTAYVPVKSTLLNGRLEIGVCFPDSCSNSDASELMTTFLELIPLEGIRPGSASCRENELELSDKAIAVTIVCSIIGFIIVMATIYDVIIQHVIPIFHLSGYNRLFEDPMYGSIKFDLAKPPTQKGFYLSDEEAETKLLKPPEPEVSRPELDDKKYDNKYVYEPSIVGNALLSFSVYTNAKKILNTDQPTGTLTSINGIRFISMTWVILGHTYSFGTRTVDNYLLFASELNSRLSFQAIANATVSVDTFFVLSGLLVGYLSLIEMKKKGGPLKINWFMFYFHRFWRLTPPYMLLLMLYVPTIKYWSDGPLWPQTGTERDECEETWWTNLLYVNNVVKSEKMCMGWSWYLANDMQFYWISPFMLIPLFYSKFFGTLACLSLILANFLSAALVSKHNEIVLGGKTLLFDKIYIKPWCRVGPYVVGIFTGYILYISKCKVKMNKIVNLFGWLCATVVALLVLYGLYNDSPEPKFNVDTSALYTATHRTAWGMAVSWVIFACATGNGGPINSLLSWKAMIPLSRLTYCAYLVHPLVLNVYYYSRRTLMRWYDLEMIYLFLAHLVISYVAAFVISLAFESPMMGLERVLLRKQKKK